MSKVLLWAMVLSIQIHKPPQDVKPFKNSFVVSQLQKSKRHNRLLIVTLIHLPSKMCFSRSQFWSQRTSTKLRTFTSTSYIPYFPAYNARVIYTKESEIVKNKHAWYTLERFPTDNARIFCTKKVSENMVLCIKHNFQLKLVSSIHSVALLNITPFKSKKFFIGLYIERINCV